MVGLFLAQVISAWNHSQKAHSGMVLAITSPNPLFFTFEEIEAQRV